jgi:hypothetical protein
MAFSFLLYTCFTFAFSEIPALEVQFLGSTNTVFVAEIASDEDSRAMGLMYRTHLPGCSGMWFDFGSPRVVAMWMRDTFVPLDIFFIGKDLSVLAIFENANPLSESLIESPPGTQYVLEINAGEAFENNLAVGQRVTVGPRGNLASFTLRSTCNETGL